MQLCVAVFSGNKTPTVEQQMKKNVFECHSGSAITNETGWYAVDMYEKSVK